MKQSEECMSVSETIINQIPMSKKRTIHHGQNLALLVKLDSRTTAQVASKMGMSRNNLFVLMNREEFTASQLEKVLLAGYKLEDITGGAPHPVLSSVSGDTKKMEDRIKALEKTVKSLEEIIADHENDMIQINAKINQVMQENKEVIKENQKLQGALEYASTKRK